MQPPRWNVSTTAGRACWGAIAAMIVPFTVAAVVGTPAGERVADRLSGAALAVGFAVIFVVIEAAVADESLIRL